jgi:UDP-N-acetylglucosamine:LPS N-acetylglucosamine transferase
LPHDIADSHNYLAACDVAITKCGWSTVTEATLAGVPMWLMLSKNGWLEERCTHREIMSLGTGVGRTLSEMVSMTPESVVSELENLRRAYDKLPRRYQNGMDQIVEIIQNHLEARG